jgi:AraC-like DNA-binding protein
MATDVVDENVVGCPAPGLRPYVAFYSGYRQRGVGAGVHRGLPSPYLVLVLTLDEPLQVERHPDPAQRGGCFDTLLGGLHTSPAVIVHQGRQSGLFVALAPLGARRLLGAPAGALAGLDVSADAVWGRFAAQLRERLLAARGWPARFAVLDAALARRLALTERAAAAPELLEAWRLLRVSGGRLPVADLADRTGWSARHLGTRFRTEIGLAPKAAARVVRFDRARRLLQQRVAAAGGPGRDLGLAGVAADCGYADQAHLAREFRELAGATASDWLLEEFRIVQAVG